MHNQCQFADCASARGKCPENTEKSRKNLRDASREAAAKVHAERNRIDDDRRRFDYDKRPASTTARLLNSVEDWLNLRRKLCLSLSLRQSSEEV
jgi:hypothetical protein